MPSLSFFAEDAAELASSASMCRPAVPAAAAGASPGRPAPPAGGGAESAPSSYFVKLHGALGDVLPVGRELSCAVGRPVRPWRKGINPTTEKPSCRPCPPPPASPGPTLAPMRLHGKHGQAPQHCHAGQHADDDPGNRATGQAAAAAAAAVLGRRVARGTCVSEAGRG